MNGVDRPKPPPARRQRAESRVAVRVERMGAQSGVRSIAEAGSARVRLPTTRDGVPEAVLINTAGGVAAGDTVRIEASVATDAALVLTTAAAEKVYRSEGETAEIVTALSLASGARLDWIPQETILFDQARLRRRLEVDMHPSATALLFEATIFGRQASGESVREGSFEDRWRVSRGGRLAYADTLRLDGPVAALLARPAVAAGARGLATLLYVAPDAEARLEPARALLVEAASTCGASAWNGLLAIRWLARDGGSLHRDVARFMTAFRGRPLPRVWHL